MSYLTIAQRNQFIWFNDKNFHEFLYKITLKGIYLCKHQNKIQ
jgi:hypothetical protein